jgi:ATP-dependent helicase HepA
MALFLRGMKIVHRAQGAWGVGHVVATSDDPPRLSAQFPGRPGEPVILSLRDPQLARFKFTPNAPAQLADGSTAVVLRALPGPSYELYRYTVETEGKKPSIRSEAELRALPPREGPLEQLASGRWGHAEDFQLRAEAVKLDLERRADALGALFASRVYVKPHQVSVAHQVLSAPQPRFVLADEVGLGKTIEAGLVLSAMLHAGLVKRCLVVAPSHLTVQWLAELFHKFNLLFTLMDPDRAHGDREAALSSEVELSSGTGDTPWARHPLVITSLEWLSRSKEEAEEAALAGWDLVIIDEAHHLRGERAYEVATALAKASWGLLLLTATPLQLDPAEYHALLRLVDPAPAATEAELRARLARQGDLSTLVRELLAGDESAREKIVALFPEDTELRGLEGEPLLKHLSESYGLSARLLRNRRSIVGGFTPRVLRKIDVELSFAERALERDVRSALATETKLPSGAVLGSLLRRLGSSPPALAAGLRTAGLEDLAVRATELASLGDTKLDAFRKLLFEELAGSKVLVFAEARETIDYLRAALAKPSGANAGIEALAYAGDLTPAERDKLVARFRDPDGPRVLLCTELGGEGRNFQHCHVLVNYDLAWSPAAIEQRIGRIDRIGQSREVRIYAFRPVGTLAARVLDVLDAGVGVFTEPVGGLDPVLERVESELLALGMGDPGTADWSRVTAEIGARVSAARAEVARAYDPLLDRRSTDVAAVKALAERGARRLGARIPAGADAAAALGAVAEHLESRLESVTIEAAKRIGLAVDIEVDVLPGEVSFHVGPELKVDALAGFDLEQDRMVLGSFRRSVSVAHEEHDSFATGHPLVEALFGWVRDGELGRATVYRARVRGATGAALDARYLVVLPEAADLAQGARVPSRRAARHLEEGLVRVVVRLDGRGGAAVSQDLAAQLDSAQKIEPVPAPDGGPPAPFIAAVELALRHAGVDAQHRLERLIAQARERVTAEMHASHKRLSRWLAQSKVPKAKAAALLEEDAKVFASAAAALDGARLELDQAALIQLL